MLGEPSAARHGSVSSAGVSSHRSRAHQRRCRLQLGTGSMIYQPRASSCGSRPGPAGGRHAEMDLMLSPNPERGDPSRTVNPLNASSTKIATTGRTRSLIRIAEERPFHVAHGRGSRRVWTSQCSLSRPGPSAQPGRQRASAAGTRTGIAREAKAVSSPDEPNTIADAVAIERSVWVRLAQS
jgi:hypothetical protein